MTIKNKKKLIEVALPLDAINKASAREKSIRHGHPSTLHLWWARRPLATARAVIFAQMVDDPSAHPDLFPTEKAQEKERQRLFRIIEDLVLWENTTNEKVLRPARDEIWQSWRYTCAENADHPLAKELFDRYKLPGFHDPFAGGGALPLEAQRLGLEAYASDLNPVAVLINKAMIEIPPKFAGRPPVNPEARKKDYGLDIWKGAQGLAEDVRYYGKWMRDEAEKRIGHLYPKLEITPEMVKERLDLKGYEGKKLTVIAWLWARTVKSPNPAFAQVDVPLVSTFMLSTKAGKEAYVEPVIEGGGYRFTVKVGKPEDGEGAKNGTKLSRGANFRCVMSGTPIPSDHIYSEAKAGRMGARLMAIVAEGDRGRVYLPPTPEMEAIALTAQPDWKPEVAMPENPRWFSPPLYGLKTYGDLFTPRQLVALTTFSDLVQEARERVLRDFLSSPPGPLSISGEGGRLRGIVRNPVVTAEKSELAKELRQQATEAEKLAWEILRNRRCLGLKFRRQQVIRGFIVDFYCAEYRLALELDGPIHDHQQEQDQKRDKALAQEGVRVLRIQNEDFTEEFLAATLSKAVESISAEGRVPISPSPDMERGLGGEDGGATAYADAVAVYLGFGVDKLSDRHSSLGRWDPTPTASGIINTFSRQALPMTWDYAEGNPFSEASGNFEGGVGWIAKVIDFSLPANCNGLASGENASDQSISSNKIISTDPPYYDNIGYADLSDFFYVWLRRSLRPIFPDLFSTLAVPKAEELVATPYRHGSKQKAETFFLDGMTQAMRRLADQAHPAFPVTIYYAFKQSESTSDSGTTNTGWDTFLGAVIHAGFSISGTWPMRTELGNRMIGSGTNALASSIVLVCRQRPTSASTATRREFITALKSELPAALAHLQRGNIAPVDLAQAAIGPGMSVYTRYAQVLDAEGNPLSVRDALSLINETLDEALAEQEGDFDSDSRWALAWFEQSGFSEGEYGVAETLSKAKNTSVSGMVDAKILSSKSGKVRLLRPEELLADWDPTTDKRLTDWEVVHHLIRVLESGGEAAAATLVTKLGSKAETARELAYRLYTLCERKKRAAEALSYNALVRSWPEITRLASEEEKMRAQPKKLKQGPLFKKTSE
jgi:adenine-specific DNA methylase